MNRSNSFNNGNNQRGGGNFGNNSNNGGNNSGSFSQNSQDSNDGQRRGGGNMGGQNRGDYVLGFNENQSDDLNLSESKDVVPLLNEKQIEQKQIILEPIPQQSIQSKRNFNNNNGLIKAIDFKIEL